MNIFKRYYFGIVWRLISLKWSICSKNSSINGKIIVYHHIGEDVIDGSDSCRCSLNIFEKTLETLSSAGFQFVSMNEALDIIDKKIDKKFIVITFDDISESVFNNAYPILKKNNIPFVVYITTDFIGKAGFINTDELSILNKDPLCTIGAHTVSHPHLRLTNNSMFDIQESKRLLENMINKPVDHFAYPYGRTLSIARKNIEEVKLSGFKSAVNTIFSDISECSSKNRYFLPRIVINK